MIQELYNNVKIQHYVYRPTRIHLFCSLKETPFGICTSRRRSSSSLARSTAISAARWAWGSDDVLILIICECNVNIMIDYDCISIYIYVNQSYQIIREVGFTTHKRKRFANLKGHPSMGIRPWDFTDYDYLPDYEVVKGIRDPEHQTISIPVLKWDCVFGLVHGW